MKINDLMTLTAQSANRIAFHLKAHSPEILLGVGVVGTIAGAVLACRATLKSNNIICDAQSQLDAVHTCLKDETKDYNEENAKKDTTVIYIQTGVKLAKLYAPAVLLGTLSLASIVTSNDILKKRSASLVAAYAAVDKGFKEYRRNVVSRFGEDVDKELRYGLKKSVESVTTVNEDGSESTEEHNVVTADSSEYSEYTRIFDELNPNWEKSSSFNMIFLTRQQAYANDLLRGRGYLFLNEVYDMLGFDRTKAGQIVGWLYDPQNPNGDNYVDFGIYQLEDDKVRDFIDGDERSIILDFNVDGPIIDSFTQRR